MRTLGKANSPWGESSCGTQPGSKHRVKGRGIASKRHTGDLIVTVDVAVPQRPNDAEKAAAETMRAAETSSPRDYLEEAV